MEIRYKKQINALTKVAVKYFIIIYLLKAIGKFF